MTIDLLIAAAMLAAGPSATFQVCGLQTGDKGKETLVRNDGVMIFDLQAREPSAPKVTALAAIEKLAGKRPVAGDRYCLEVQETAGGVRWPISFFKPQPFE